MCLRSGFDKTVRQHGNAIFRGVKPNISLERTHER